MTYHPDLETLKLRFEVFIAKLLEKASELEQEVKMSVQEIYDEDPDHYKRAYGQFKLGIEGQFKTLIEKATDVFNHQIRPLRNESGYTNISNWYIEMHDLSRNFEDRIQYKIRTVFDKVVPVSNEVHLQNILDEYEAIKDAFKCSQCSANLSIDQLYFVATYITCPYCQTQNTFVPGTRMKQLEGMSRELAEERLQLIKDQYLSFQQTSAAKYEKLTSYIFYRAYVWVEKSKIVPIYAENYLKVFFREVHDTLSGIPSNKLVLEDDLYFNVVQTLGFKKEMIPIILNNFKNKNFKELKIKLMDWEMLLQLSSVTTTQLFQGSSHQCFHEEQFGRIQQEWETISEINKAIDKNEIDYNEAINKIRLKFN